MTSYRVRIDPPRGHGATFTVSGRPALIRELISNAGWLLERLDADQAPAVLEIRQLPDTP